MRTLIRVLRNRKYEFLFFGLTQHLFAGIFFKDLEFYFKYIWPLTTVILAVCCYEVFWEKGSGKKLALALLTLGVCVLPIVGFFSGFNLKVIEFMTIVYVAFFGYIFIELMRFLLRPSYLSADVLSASICGYMLLIEMMTFLLQTLYYHFPHSFKNIDISSTATIYIDLVYFSTATLTTIGFGDIVAAAPQMKLLVSFFGIVGQIYSVVLVGILISKFTINKRQF